MLVFGERENHSTRGKPSQNRVENQQAQSTYDGRSGIKPGQCWWKISALTLRHPCSPPFKSIDLSKFTPASISKRG